MKPPYIPKRQILAGPGFVREILRALREGALRQGEATGRLGSWFARYLSVPDALPVSSGRTALALAFRDWGIGPGDEIILPAFTFKALPAYLIRLGLRPVFVDADPGTFNMRPDGILEKITPRTRAVLATHLFGFPMDMRSVLDVAKDEGLRVIEDCAHALGAELDGRKVGTLGDAGFFSFGVSKTVNTFAGGMLVSRDGEMIARCRRAVRELPFPPRLLLAKEVLRTFAYRLATWEPFFTTFERPAFGLLNARDIDYLAILRARKREFSDAAYRFTNLQARVGLLQTDSIESHLHLRREQAAFLSGAIPASIRTPAVIGGAAPSSFMFVMRHEDKDEICRELYRRRIDVNRVFMDHCPPLFSDHSPYPVSEKLFRECFMIQLGPGLTRRHLVHLAETLTGLVPPT